MQPHLPPIQRGPALVAVGGLDPGGKAGLAADLHTAWAHGLAARPVVAARTAQRDGQWLGAWPSTRPELTATLEAVAQPPLLAVKTGMLGSPDGVEAVADWLALLGAVPLVADPLAHSSSGGWMWPGADPAAVRAALWTRLLPRATVATPNWPELAWWCGEAVAGSLDEVERQARQWPCPLLIKGGHAALPWRGVDLLWDGRRLVQLRRRPPWPEGLSPRGTGCRLATALAIALGRGLALADACETAAAWLDGWVRAEHGA